MTSRDTLRNDGTLGVLTHVNHLGTGISLLIVVGNGYAVELSYRVVATQDAGRILPGNRRTCLYLSPAQLRVHTTQVASLGYQVQHTTLTMFISRIPVLNGRVLHLSIILDDNLHDSRMELSSYFRINARNTGQFERTLIIADDDAYVSYLEGCTAPMRDENQLHAAIVEIIVKDNAEVKYSTVQNWYPGDEHGKGGVLNLVTKRGDLRGVNSKLSWTQVETGSAITWKYPSCILRGDNSVAEFYSVAVTNNYQEADTGTKMIHMGKNTKSTIISKGISAGHSQNSYRGLVRATSNADNARNYSSCDSLLLGSDCGAHTFPYMDAHNDTAVFEHEATTSKISEDQLFYCNQRGIPTEEAVGLIVNGYAKDVLNKLPMEFAVEAQKLLSVSLEGTVG